MPMFSKMMKVLVQIEAFAEKEKALSVAVDTDQGEIFVTIVLQEWGKHATDKSRDQILQESDEALNRFMALKLPGVTAGRSCNCLDIEIDVRAFEE